MSARAPVQRMHGMGDEPLASTGDIALQPPRLREPLAADPDRSQPRERVSPDPLQATDRYRLVMPFQPRL